MRGVTRKSRFRFDDYKFQPALPMRGVTFTSELVMLSCVFQPALPMRGVTILLAVVGQRFHISTRTPHAGSDHAGRDAHDPAPFQPALPMRGVTFLQAQTKQVE